MEGTFTVFFDDPFWVGVFERFDNGRLSVCKVTFGAEPKEQEIYEFVLKTFLRTSVQSGNGYNTAQSSR